MRKSAFHNVIILFLMLAAISMIAVGCSNGSNPGTNTVERSFCINYSVTEGGNVSSGERMQIVEQGKNGTEVTVTPKDGFRFAGWSDGLTATTRRETNVQSNMNFTATFSKISLSLKYTAGLGGQIIGEKEQNIKYGETATSVTATPNDGFLFAGWSDGIMSETRQDKDIKNDVEVSAKFVSKTKTFTYNYNNATANNAQKNITLTYDNLAGTTFPIPQRERFIFSGWYLEPTFETMVANAGGTLFLGNGVFFTESNTLYAKWTVAETTTYKILMVFVDEVHARLKTADGVYIDVDYKMSLVERKICELIPNQISKYLNSWFEGLVNFEIDAYFTTVPLGNEAFSSGMSSSGKRDYSIFANDIPEIGLLLKNYRSVITTSCMNDYDKLLQTNAGSASTKYAFIHMEMFLNPLKINNIPYENYLDLSFESWNTLLEVYIHEFTHTIELGLIVYDYHAVEIYYANNQIWGLSVTKLYLLNQAVVDGETVGIPYYFWKGEIDVLVSYLPNIVDGWDAGKIVIVGGAQDNNSSAVYKKIPFGSSITVEAIPFEGFRFLKWSDGIATAIRNDVNVISYLKVTALFVKV